MATTKKVNYTPAQEKQMVSEYTACGAGLEKADFEARQSVVEHLAETIKADMPFSNAVRSIRAKLTSLKVYIKANAAVSTVTGAEAMKKDAMAEKVNEVSGLSLNTDSIAKMNKLEIQAFIDAVSAVEVLKLTLADYRLEFGDLPETETEENE